MSVQHKQVTKDQVPTGEQKVPNGEQKVPNGTRSAARSATVEHVRTGTGRSSSTKDHVKQKHVAEEQVPTGTRSALVEEQVPNEEQVPTGT